MFNAAIINGLPRLIPMLALAKQQAINLNRIYAYTGRKQLPRNSLVVKLAHLFGLDVYPIPPIPRNAQKIHYSPDVLAAINNVDNLIAVYRTTGAKGAEDRQTIRYINAKKTYGVVEGLSINVYQEASKEGLDKLYSKGVYVDQREHSILNRYHQELSGLALKTITSEHMDEIESRIVDSPLFKELARPIQGFINAPYALLVCQPVDNKALFMSQAEHVAFWARAAKAILSNHERLYVKLHPADTWETGFLIREILRDYADRLYISDFRYDGSLPIQLLSRKKPPEKVYVLSSTAMLYYSFRNIPVVQLESTANQYAHISVQSCMPGLRLPKLTVNCSDCCVVPEHLDAFDEIRKISPAYKRKIIFGFGKKGRQLLEAIDTYYPSDSMLVPDFVVDDAPSRTRFRQWNIFSPEDINWREDDVVFLATDTFQDALRKSLDQLDCPARIVELF